MTSKASWEIDPDTRSKLLAIQKSNQNNHCVDCSAPSPQWASSKFGAFICLSCAGIHRGLGVHISFVRSITMDAFKEAEIERMRLGGNQAWKEFFEGHERNVNVGVSWDDTTIAERYSGEVGEEYRERLSAKVEGREYIPAPASSSNKPLSTSRSGTPSAPQRTDSPSRSSAPAPGGKVRVDDKYFTNLGATNASRPEDLPPSQGGKYSGFGSAPPERTNSNFGNGGSLPGFENLQNNPVAAISKGFGWFTSTVGKTAKSVNEGYIQPTAQKLAETDLAAQARLTAAQVAKGAQTGARSAADGFNRFVEGNDNDSRKVHIDESKKDFWDSFSEAGNLHNRAGGGGRGNIGTGALKGSGGSAGGIGGGGKKKDDDGWGDW